MTNPYTITANLLLKKYAAGVRGWDTDMNANLDVVDAAVTANASAAAISLATANSAATQANNAALTAGNAAMLAQQTAASIDSVSVMANGAAVAALDAQTAADGALNVANVVATEVDAVQVAADNAAMLAQQASASIDSVSVMANGAAVAAVDAQSTADNALSIASTVATEISAVQATADNAAMLAQQTAASIDSVSVVANGAAIAAVDAQSTADNALSISSAVATEISAVQATADNALSVATAAAASVATVTSSDGSIILGVTAPAGGTWLPCNAQIVNQSDYPGLFASVGILPPLVNFTGNTSLLPLATLTQSTFNTVTSILHIEGTTQGGNYNLDLAQSAGSFVFTWNGVSSPPMTWVTGAIVTINGGVAGSLSFTLGDATVSQGVAAATDVIAVGYSAGSKYKINSIAYGNGVMVAVGDSGVMATSVDGVAWTQRSMGATGSFYSVNYAAVDNGSPLNINSVAFGNGTFVAIANNAACMTSTDGVSWVNQAALSFGGTLAFGNGLFVCMSPMGSFETSTNGSSWAVAAQALSSGNITCFGFSNTGVATSSTYNRGTDNTLLTINSLSGVIVPGGYTLTVTADPGNSQNVFISWNGVSSASVPWGETINQFSNSTVTIDGGNAGIITVTTEQSVIPPSPSSDTIQAVLLGASFTAFGTDVSNNTLAYQSVDGIHWVDGTISLTGTDVPLVITNIGTLYVAAGSNGYCISSNDGLLWNSGTLVNVFPQAGLGNAVTGIACDGEILLAVSQNGTMATSKDGINWISVVQTLGGTLDSIYLFSYLGLFIASVNSTDTKIPKAGLMTTPYIFDTTTRFRLPRVDPLAEASYWIKAL